MDNLEDYQKNKITIGGKDYYTITDFVAASGIILSTVYQRIRRKTIPENHIHKLGKVILISAVELDEIMKRRVRLKKIEQIFDNKNILNQFSDKEIDKLNDLLDKKE